MTELDKVEIVNGINKLCEFVYQLAVQKGWHDRPHNTGEQFMLMCTEIAEAMECYRNGMGPRDVVYGPTGKPEGIPSEIADAVIRIAAWAGENQIDLGLAVVEKHEYNETRPYRHGGKIV